MFMAYNNGISTVADSIDIDESQSSGDVVTITEIAGWQINGGQTTASIYNAYKSKTASGSGKCTDSCLLLRKRPSRRYYS